MQETRYSFSKIEKSHFMNPVYQIMSVFRTTLTDTVAVFSRPLQCNVSQVSARHQGYYYYCLWLLIITYVLISNLQTTLQFLYMYRPNVSSLVLLLFLSLEQRGSDQNQPILSTVYQSASPLNSTPQARALDIPGHGCDTGTVGTTRKVSSNVYRRFYFLTFNVLQPIFV